MEDKSLKETLQEFLDKFNDGNRTIDDIVSAAREIIETMPSPWSEDEDPSEDLDNSLTEWLIYVQHPLYVKEHGLEGLIEPDLEMLGPEDGLLEQEEETLEEKSVSADNFDPEGEVMQNPFPYNN